MPRHRHVPALLLALGAVLGAGCAGVEGDLRRAEFREGLLDLVKGKDRGVYGYRLSIRNATVQARGANRYQYVAPAHVSNFLVARSIRGLGGTRLRTAAETALAVDQLLDVLARDPTAAMRSSACHQLGRILLRLGLPLDEPVEGSPQSEARIHEAAADLLDLRRRSDEGERITIARVVERMEALASERPVRLHSAREAVRALATPPVAANTSAAIAAEAAKITPTIVRDAILVSLAEVACGRPQTPDAFDESPLVRAHAAEVLTRIASPVARDSAVQRLSDRLDPAERDPDVRRQLVDYLGAVGGDAAFTACLARLDDSDLGVRYHAQGALVRMTGAQVEPTATAWRAWKEAQVTKGP